MGEEICERQKDGGTVVIFQYDRDSVRITEFTQHLTADTARRKPPMRFCIFAAYHSNGNKIASAGSFTDRFEERHTFGAYGRGEGRVFNIATVVDLRIAGQQCGTDPTAGIGGIRSFSGDLRFREQLLRSDIPGEMGIGNDTHRVTSGAKLVP